MMKRAKFLKNLILIGMVCLSVVFSVKSYSSMTYADSSVIRVGLEGIYHNQASMTIRNSSVVMGYCVNNVFVSEVQFNAGGLTFTPYTDSFSVSGSYSNYEEAYEAAKDKGTNCVPIVTWQSTWAVATLGAGNFDKYAVRVTGENVDILYTIDDRSQYPQFVADN